MAGRSMRDGSKEELREEIHELLRKIDALLRKIATGQALPNAGSVSADLLEVVVKERAGRTIAMVVRVPEQLFKSLTRRERDVASLMGRALGNKGIARRLRISENRTAHLIEQIKTKWNVRTRAEIARYAWILF